MVREALYTHNIAFATYCEWIGLRICIVLWLSMTYYHYKIELCSLQPPNKFGVNFFRVATEVCSSLHAIVVLTLRIISQEINVIIIYY